MGSRRRRRGRRPRCGGAQVCVDPPPAARVESSRDRAGRGARLRAAGAPRRMTRVGNAPRGPRGRLGTGGRGWLKLNGAVAAVVDVPRPSPPRRGKKSRRTASPPCGCVRSRQHRRSGKKKWPASIRVMLSAAEIPQRPRRPLAGTTIAKKGFSGSVRRSPKKQRGGLTKKLPPVSQRPRHSRSNHALLAGSVALVRRRRRW